jgi:preprotein translocase subunit YajC
VFGGKNGDSGLSLLLAEETMSATNELAKKAEIPTELHWQGTRAFKDCIIIIAASILTSVLVFVLGAFDIFQQWARNRREWMEWRIHDYVFILVILVVALAIFTLRRWRELRLLEEKHSRLIAELRESLAKVRTLSGLLPICANCKKIRDDKGYWNQIETYIRDRSEAKFTHGICPECIQRLYPDEVQRWKLAGDGLKEM